MENSINTPVQPDICKQRLPNSIRLWAQSSIYRLEHGILYRKAESRGRGQIPGKRKILQLSVTPVKNNYVCAVLLCPFVSGWGSLAVPSLPAPTSFVLGSHLAQASQ